jgi:hypothetical protein
MKWKPFKLPIAVRVFIFVLGVVSASLPIRSIYSGYFDMMNHGTPNDISMARDPLAFWALAIIFSLLSAGLFYVAFARRYPDA